MWLFVTINDNRFLREKEMRFMIKPTGFLSADYEYRKKLEGFHQKSILFLNRHLMHKTNRHWKGKLHSCKVYLQGQCLYVFMSLCSCLMMCYIPSSMVLTTNMHNHVPPVGSMFLHQS